MNSLHSPLSPVSPDGTVRDDGIWAAVRPSSEPRFAGGPALFLDRDGVINEDSGYVHRVEDFVLIDGAAGLIRGANACGIAVIIVTNQSGVGRGLYDWAAFEAFQTKLEEELAHAGAVIDAAFACPFHRDGVPPYNVDDHPARKPNPGMLLAGRDALSVDMKRSWMIGDRTGDIEAAARAGLEGGILVSGSALPDTPDHFMAQTAASTAEAANLLAFLRD